MALIDLQLGLKYQETPGEPDEYFLEIKSVFDEPNWVDQGHDPIAPGWESSGELAVALIVVEDPNSNDDDESSSEIIHLLSLGAMPSGLDELEVDITIVDTASQLKGKGKRRVRNADAKVIGKPN